MAVSNNIYPLSSPQPPFAATGSQIQPSENKSANAPSIANSVLEREYASMPSEDLKRKIALDQRKIAILQSKVSPEKVNSKEYERNLKIALSLAVLTPALIQVIASLSTQEKNLLKDLVQGISKSVSTVTASSLVTNSASASMSATSSSSSSSSSSSVSTPASTGVPVVSSATSPEMRAASRIQRLVGHLVQSPTSGSSPTKINSKNTSPHEITSEDQKMIAMLASLSPEQLLALKEGAQIQKNIRLKEKILTKRQKTPAPLNYQRKPKDRFILSIDGGGIRGIIPAK